MSNNDHYPTLDGLRGLAAMGVLFYHLAAWTSTGQLVGHGSLAVDIFFCLSGFVIAHVYEKRLATGMSAVNFIERRLIRLAPLVAFGTLVSLAYVLLRGHIQHGKSDPMAALIAACLGLVFAPDVNAPVAIGGPQLFPLNGPEWSLALEILINLVWVAGHRSLRTSHLAVLAVSCALAQVFVSGGDTVATFWNGLPRVTGGFASGLLVYRLHHAGFGRDLKLPTAVPILAVAVVLMMPALGALDGLARGIWALLISPAVVLLSLRQSRPSRAMTWLGELSYPIYILQFPIFAWTNGIMQIAKLQLPAPLQVAVLAGSVVIGATVSLLFFDRPARALLARWSAERGRRRLATARGAQLQGT